MAYLSPSLPIAELDPLPYPAGDPPPELWAESGLPPDGFRFTGARRTCRCWMLPCPCCCRSWCGLLPAESGDLDEYRLAPIGCSRGCDPASVAWWWAWKLGELPPAELPEPRRAQAYVLGAVRRASYRIVEASDPLRALRAEAYQLGRLAAGAGVDPVAPARGLALAAARAGLAESVTIAVIRTNIMAGSAAPREIRL